jgi:hypothetical protein
MRDSRILAFWMKSDGRQGICDQDLRLRWGLLLTIGKIVLYMRKALGKE